MRVLEIGRPGFEATRDVTQASRGLSEFEVRLKVERYGLSSNNVTYAAVGEMLRYWDFFPASDPAESNGVIWGRVPVWGFASVIESQHPGVKEGERLFGYLPMSDELNIAAGKVHERTITDVSAHRAHLPGAYNSFTRCAADPMYREEHADLQMLLYPLFFTSFTIDDFLEDNKDYGATTFVLSSASSKTSIGTAQLLRRRGKSVVALTSTKNRAFVESVGIYDKVVTYDEVATLEHVPSVYIDVAGSRSLARSIHEALGESLTYSMVVGDTHWDEVPAPDEGPLVGPRPQFHFAPNQIEKRSKEWGAEELSRRVASAWADFVAWVPSWLTLREIDDQEHLATEWLRMVRGDVDPAEGVVVVVK